MKWVSLPCSSITTSFTSPIVSPVEVSTFLPISLETRCLSDFSDFFQASLALAGRIESEDWLSSSLEVGGVADPLDVVELGEVVSEPEIGGVPVVLGSWLGSWL
jgi:hypothetical protein